VSASGASAEKQSPGPIGAHVPTAGGLARSGLRYCDATAAGVVQVYVSNPRGWRLTDGDPAQDEAFRAGCGERDVPAYVHASLLVNLGSPTPATVDSSAATLAHALRRARQIGARAVVFHAGTAVGDGRRGSAVDEGHTAAALRQVGRVLRPLLDEAAGMDGPRLLVEPSAGGGRCLASRVEDLGPYFEAVDWHPWLGVCLDTCHAWAAGHDLATAGGTAEPARPSGMAQTLDTLVATVGPGRLGLVHANDSRDECGSLRDRHENIGRGRIGEAPFAELLRHPAAAGIPVIVETPSTGATGHAADIATLIRLATPVAARRRRLPPPSSAAVEDGQHGTPGRVTGVTSGPEGVAIEGSLGEP
jgi:deoxyribonuclease-4